MKVSELKRELKAIGCYFVSHGGRHDTWFSPITKIKFQIPRHDAEELKKGTEMKIRKLAGLK